MPAIVSDIDGVVVQGSAPTPGTKEALSQLLNPWLNTQRRMPFMFLSNGGGSTEQTKADGMNKLIGLSGQGRITENEVVLCHTILKSKHF